MSPIDDDARGMIMPAGLDVDLRRHVAHLIVDRRDVIVADTVATFPHATGSRRLDADYCVRLGNQVTRLLSEGILDGVLDFRASGISELASLVTERDLLPDRLFTFVYLAMSTAIDEMSLDPRVGANTDPWPQATQIVRRAAFDLLAAWTTRLLEMPQRGAIEDPLTTLHTRPVFDAVLPKECQRAERFEHWVSLLLVDVDHLSAINKAHGYGVGDRILERMGILLRSYFRLHDWVARFGEDTVAVLLPETTPDDAMTLAERTRTMVEDRLTFRDYRTDQRATVTVSVAAASARALEGEPIDHNQFQAVAEAALERAKTGGRNRVEQVLLQPRLISIEETSVILNTNLDGIERLVAEGKLEPIKAGRHVRLERHIVELLARMREN